MGSEAPAGVAGRPRSLGELAQLLFGLEGRVSRGAYATVGFGLMVLKYAVDAYAIHAATGQTWMPWDYLNPVFTLREAKLVDAPSSFSLAMGLWTMPFLWVGASMSLRRALDAGKSPWTALFFFVPVVNYGYMLVLACLPSAKELRTRVVDDPLAEGPVVVPATVAHSLRSALVAALLASIVTVLFMLLSVYVLHRYSTTLFLGAPFFLGLVAGYVHNMGQLQSLRSTIVVALLSLALAGGVLLLFALEGIVCLVMALGLALPLVLAGAVFGRALARFGPGTPQEATLGLLFLPLLTLAEGAGGEREPYEAVTAIEVDAPIEVVWEHVVSFGDLPAPSHWLFDTGVAYPLRARIEGVGVGAVRHCEFSTGAFVEPITVWEEPTRLAFDVASQPDPMEEWSFYKEIHPPHLSTSFRSVRGEFRLTPLAGGRTRLEGSTWYVLDIGPRFYWRFLADGIVHQIHDRVLAHVAAGAEARR